MLNYMNSRSLRDKFLNFFKGKDHIIFGSAPMVIKDDPTLMFTNAGMNQFKNIFLGNSPIQHKRIANSQKCLRVSGKHNDLEEVGKDTYHHTMFEMLGNWSFGDYFKKEAIEWAFEFLVEELHIPEDRLYATVFEGDNEDNLELDKEAYAHWQKLLPDERILKASKKDNFWEMGNTGPCGPCSEIHIDWRSDEEREKIPGSQLVNKDNPLVIEIWNLVFIQYNRKSDGKLELLPMKHIDTGMGFERLCMIVQGKHSNYETDLFIPVIEKIAGISGKTYGQDENTDIAMRVIADHLRAIAFSITDGQLPSNNKAGYVIRRILRRAVRYGYTFLDQQEPFIFMLVPTLIQTMGQAYPELEKQQELIEKVIKEEESAFLRTLDTGIKMLDDIFTKRRDTDEPIISGKDAFVLYDTYGFPLDLTELIAQEKGYRINKEEFNKEMQAQRKRSKDDARQESADWVYLEHQDSEPFIGYDHLESGVKITRYRKVKAKNKEIYHLVFDKTPFYPESGGQVGDTGYIENDEEKINIIDTQKENELIIHYAKKLPRNLEKPFKAAVDKRKRISTANNHSATHLLHYALRQVLGHHVEQKGSLVHPDYLRFDFSHFQKLSDEEIRKIEKIVNDQIRRNYAREEQRNIPLSEAKKMGATALFGEKYGEKVRTIKFGDTIELCGGTHVDATGQIGFFKIISESAISAGIRRIEAVTGARGEEYIEKEMDTLDKIREILNNAKNPVSSIEKLVEEKEDLAKTLAQYKQEKKNEVKENLKKQIKQVNGINIIAEKVDISEADDIRDLAFKLKNEVSDLYLILGAENKGKAVLSIMISENLLKEKGLDANKIVREAAKEIKGGGGGQAFFATAGGKDVKGLYNAISKAEKMVNNIH